MFELAFDQFWSRWNNNSGKHCQRATRMNNFLIILIISDSSIWIRSIRTIFGTKIQAKKTYRIHKDFLSYIKSSCIIFCPNIINISRYYSQVKSTYFGLRTLYNFGVKVLGVFLLKKIVFNN